MPTIRGRGPQVVLEGYARTVARGAAGRTMRENIAAMDALVIAGLASDGNSVDGSSRTGATPYDTVVAQFPRETLSAWAIPAPLLDINGGGPVSIINYGADPTGVADSASAINAAIATGKPAYMPAGHYHVRSQINVGPSGVLFGAGRGVSVLTVSGDFDPASLGVVVMTGSDDLSPILQDFSINFAQPPDQASRANFRTLAAGGTSFPGGTGVMYPPAILNNQPSGNRFKLARLQIQAAWDGIKTTTNCAPYIEDIEMCALNCGLYIGNTRDIFHVKGYHFWPFGINASTVLFTSVYGDGATFAARFGDNGGVNGANILDFNCFLGRISITDPNTWVHISNLMMDGNNATLEISGGGWIQITNVYFTGGVTGANTIPAMLSISGGRTFISNIYASVGNSPAISVSNGLARIIAGRLTQASANVSTVLLSGGTLLMSDIGFTFNIGAGPWTAPVVNATAGVISFQNNRFDLPSVGDIGGLVIATDSNQNVVGGNFWNGWGWTPPGFLGAYGFDANLVAPNSVIMQRDASIGTATGTHAANLNLNGANGTQRAVVVYTASSLRWGIFINGLESGSNSGGDFSIGRYSDAGSPIDLPITIIRSTGRVLAQNLEAISFGLATGPVGRQTVTGAKGGNTALASLLAAMTAYGLITDNTTA